jgi:hypothetical protein
MTNLKYYFIYYEQIYIYPKSTQYYNLVISLN